MEREGRGAEMRMSREGSVDVLRVDVDCDCESAA